MENMLRSNHSSISSIRMKSMLVLTFTPITVPDTEEATDYLFSELMDVWIYLSPIK